MRCSYCNSELGEKVYGSGYCNRSCWASHRNKLTPHNVGKVFSEEWRSNIGRATSTRTHSEETKSKIKNTLLERYSSIPNNSSNYRSRALEYYGTICHVCSREDNLDVHHIRGLHDDHSFDNLLVLCKSCHMTKAHTIIRPPGLRGSLTTILNEEFRDKILKERGLL